ncbi:hypothetical protein [Aggregatibacter actinomycetemcomitans]|uniref:hypothetical protein n=1 Tax=Aggregatibacter actinomycetemcomitans TaxID=714 RepID=UPI001652AE37|nr:hypothetical protein [Aggregatibacter actinomycetemcomitans]
MSALIDDSVNVHVCAILSVQAWMLEPSGEKISENGSKEITYNKKAGFDTCFFVRMCN